MKKMKLRGKTAIVLIVLLVVAVALNVAWSDYTQREQAEAEMLEKARILSALQKHNYNRTLTAEALNISRKTLFNNMKRYNLGNE